MQIDRLLFTLCKRVQSHDCLPWLTRYLSCSSLSGEIFTESIPPEGNIDTKQIGPWLLVTVSISYEGTTDGPTTDRAGGDPYSAQVRYDWIGPAASAPHKVTDSEELNAWAVLSTYYVREYTDVGSWGVHEGSWIESLGEDGTVTIREATGRFQDELPESKSTGRTITLKMPHALNEEQI